jgi:hypothetical protein
MNGNPDRQLSTPNGWDREYVTWEDLMIFLSNCPHVRVTWSKRGYLVDIHIGTRYGLN